jgi:tRNA modification GTPase
VFDTGFFLKGNVNMNETIAAIATAYGEGGIGIIRISGESSEQILRQIFVPVSHARKSNQNVNTDNQRERDSQRTKSRVLRYGTIVDPKTGETIDEVLTVFMKAPATYTREDVAEIHCHGSIISLHKTLSLCLQLGARPAEPGEFTKRAFLNGRLDLSQAEAVIDMIRAKTTKSFEVAVGQLEGRLSREIVELRKQLLDLLVNMTVNIDYPDEDIEEIMYDQMLDSISQIGGEIDKLILTADTGRILQEGLNVVIIGKPNVGKSSLMNALMRETRAIVTEIPGTTRDTIQETISIKGIPIRLTDTAGIRDTEDTIEQIGIAKTKESFRKADLILMMLDVSEELSDEDKYIIEHIGDKRTILLANKIDLGAKTTMDEIKQFLPGVKMIETSMVSDVGLEEIEHEIQQMVYGGKVSQSESLMVTNTRHETLLREAGQALADAASMTQDSEPLELIEAEVRHGYEVLGEIIGETVSDDILDEVFSRFCLGK